MEEYKKDDRGRSKALRLTKGDPKQKVDSSTWTPESLENNDIKTGARPLVKRLFKKGGKVVGKSEGKNAEFRADRKPRKSGGRTSQLTPDSLINRDVRMANDVREGVKHEGAFKKGGKAHKASGGKLGKYIDQAMENYGKAPNNPKNKQRMTDGVQMAASKISGGSDAKVPATHKSGGRAHKLSGGALVDYINSAAADMGKTGAKQPFDYNRASKRSEGVDLAARKLANQNVNVPASGMKKGGRTGKLGGGMVGDNPVSISDRSMSKAAGMMKKGGRAKHATYGTVEEALDDNPMPRKEMETLNAKSPATEQAPPSEKPYKYKGSAPKTNPNTGYKKGGHVDEAEDKALIKRMVKPEARTGRKSGGEAHGEDCSCHRCSGGRTMKYSGGGVFSGDSKTKIPGATGGRSAHAKGGRTKGKTQVNIIIGAHGQPQGGVMPNAPVPAPVSQRIPPAPQGGMPPQAGMPPQGMPPQGMPPQGMPPMGRKSGGRTSYPIETGSGGGEARLDKIKAYGLKPSGRK